MKNKSILNRLKNQYFTQLVFAKHSGFEAVILPMNCDSEPYYMEDSQDKEYMNDIASESGWTQFAIIDFVKKVESTYDLYDVA